MNDRKARLLLTAAKLVYERFMAGHHPSTAQLDLLGGAIEDIERMKVCGHLEDEECECYE